MGGKNSGRPEADAFLRMWFDQSTLCRRASRAADKISRGVRSGAHRKTLSLLRGDRGFESSSLQQRVRCELRNRLHSRIVSPCRPAGLPGALWERAHQALECVRHHDPRVQAVVEQGP